MTLHQLQVFAVISKLGSFTKAASELHVGQPTVSSLMVELQKELGVKLFEKFGIKTHLTEAGRRFLQKNQKILALIQEAKDEMEDFKGLKKGKITVGGSGFAGSCFLPLAVQEFKNQYPAIDVTLKIDRSQALEKMLLDGTIDLAVLGRPSQCSHLFVEPYREADLVFVAPPNHPLTRKRSVSLQAIAKEPLIVSRDGSHVRSMLEQEFAARGLPFSPLLEIDIHQLGARDAEKNAVASGLGIGFLSGCYVESDVKAGRLKVLKVSELKLKRLISIAVHKNRRNSPHVQVFSEFLKRYEQ